VAKENNMNFQDLYQKIKNIEEGVETPVEECGMPMPMSSPGQQDSVTMSVNMNGNGSGGIKDLMNILKNIEQNAEPMNPHPHTADKLFGDGYENSEQGDQGAVTLDIADITQTGDDMHSKGSEAPKVNGGGNPMQEALVSRLAQMYDEIKEAKTEKFNPLKHVKNPTKGEKEAAKDVKRGSYADRAAMLKSAEAAGRLKEGEKKTMSRAAKGHEKYGKEGMQALAKAGKEGKDLDKIRDKYNKYDEAYNPNSVDAEHRRKLEKSYEDTLKKKAAEGDESAKKRLQALKDKKERMRNDYDARMER
jgi:hypothetical protein